MHQVIQNFNLRVYGIALWDGKVLITDENRSGMLMTKFPGGGLEKGEGLADCLVREFEEELDIAVNVEDLFYVNEFLQVSAFAKQDQLISFYYWVSSPELEKISTINSPESVPPNNQFFRWVALNELDVKWFRFPIDKVVCEKLKRIRM